MTLASLLDSSFETGGLMLGSTLHLDPCGITFLVHRVTVFVYFAMLERQDFAAYPAEL